MIARARIAFFTTVDWYFCRHYLALARAVQDAGYGVTVITGVETHGDCIRSAGFDLIPISISRKGMNPLRELPALLRIVRILRRLRPELVHCIAQKPVFYGGLAAHLVGTTAVVAALPGLGWLFTSPAWSARLGRALVILGYRLLLRRANVRVLVQNADDQAELARRAGLAPLIIPGSGVDLKRFSPHPTAPDPVTVVLASRLLWDKGVGELVDAAQQLLDRGIPCRCVLVGEPDPGNPASVSRRQLGEWQTQGVIDWWGYQSDMTGVLARAHIACLPSYYREGIPKFLLEAVASGLPVVTTDAPGCRETVEEGVNGFLVPPRDAGALANALERLILDSELRERFGRRSRAMAEARFGVERVAAATLGVYAELLGTAMPRPNG